MAITYPKIDPVLLQIGPLAIRWYALAYIAALVFGWLWIRRLSRQVAGGFSETQAESFFSWATVGVLLGGRLGYVLFYMPEYYLFNPLDILKIWGGGMSFHGGFLGVVLALVIFTRRAQLPFMRTADILGCATPAGLFFGRVANFINGELFGRRAPAELPWAMTFPGGGDIPRHPSQLYEALGEGVFLFLLINFIWRFPAVRERPGLTAGTFVLGYALIRLGLEQFRQPDAHLGFVLGPLTQGQLLTIPLALLGGWAIFRALRRPPVPADPSGPHVRS